MTCRISGPSIQRYTSNRLKENEIEQQKGTVRSNTCNMMTQSIDTVTDLLTIIAIVWRRALLITQVLETLNTNQQITIITNYIVKSEKLTGLHLQVPSQESQCKELFGLHWQFLSHFSPNFPSGQLRIPHFCPL